MILKGKGKRLSRPSSPFLSHMRNEDSLTFLKVLHPICIESGREAMSVDERTSVAQNEELVEGPPAEELEELTESQRQVRLEPMTHEAQAPESLQLVQ